jgi:hypothetical protein
VICTHYFLYQDSEIQKSEINYAFWIGYMYSSPNIIEVIKPRRKRLVGHVARMGDRRSAYRVLVGRPDGKRSLGRLRLRWENEIKMYLPVVG